MFNQCASNMGFTQYDSHNLPVLADHVAIFVAYLSQSGYSPSSIVSYTSALGYAHKLAGCENPVASFLIQKMLAGVTRLSPSVDSRLPITTIILSSLINSLTSTVSNLYHRVLTRAMLVFSFYGLMRIGEITSSKGDQPAINLSQIQLTSNRVVVTISKFKHNLHRQPFQIVMPKQSDQSICPVYAITNYLLLRGFQPGPLFCHPDGAPISRAFFATKLKQTLIFAGFNPALYKSHSLRIGGASHYAELGYSDAQIRFLGRWKSDAFIRYIRSHRIHN